MTVSFAASYHRDRGDGKRLLILSDPDGDSLTAVLVSDVSHGSLTLNSNGSFHYTASTDSSEMTGPVNGLTRDHGQAVAAGSSPCPFAEVMIVADAQEEEQHINFFHIELFADRS